MVVVPAATAVARPEPELIVALLVSLEVQVAETGALEPSE